MRVLNDSEKCKSVGNLFRGWKVDLVCLQETTVAVVSCALVRSLWGGPHVKWCCLEVEGASGGILCLWDSCSMKLVESSVGVFSISMIFKNVDDGVQWIFLEVYGPNGNISRRLLCYKLAGIYSWWNLPWCIEGDFNVTHFSRKRLGGGSNRSPMMEFLDFLSELELVDLVLAGGLFT